MSTNANSYETLLYAERDGIAFVTLNRPEALNAFDTTMMREVQDLWRSLRTNDDVRCVVLTGSGERAFCVGIDRNADDTYVVFEKRTLYGTSNNYMYDDPGRFLGPKSNDLWKPVICAVNGMACGGAFYMLGEVEFIVAAERATFFDPHVTYGMTAAFEPIHMAGITPFTEIMRLSLLGNYERMSAQRAYQVGMVTEVVPDDQLLTRARELAAIIASQPKLAIEGTVRAIWSTRSMPQREAVRLGYAYVAMGTSQDSIAEGQKMFASGKRVEWKLR
jgi:enoyl-CoA hydratase/carnithine racemase